MAAGDPYRIYRHLAEQLHVPFVVIGDELTDLAAVQAVPAGIAREFAIAPLRFHDGTLEVANSEPLDFFTLDNLRYRLGIACIAWSLATTSDVKNALLRRYGA